MADCTTSKVQARMLSISDETLELQRHRRRQKTKTFRRTYKRRIIAEHRLGRLIQLGIRQARYFGKAKGAFQVAMAATVANLALVLSKPPFGLSRASKAARMLVRALRILITLIRSTPPESAVSVTLFPTGTMAPTGPCAMAYSRPAF